MTEETTKKIEELGKALDESVENIQKETEQIEQRIMFGLRLATSAQILQGMLSGQVTRTDNDQLIQMSVDLADKLIEACQE
jgi:hypothetical protein